MTHALQTFVQWDTKLGIRRTIVLFVTLWLTWSSFYWAAGFAYAMKGMSGTDIAAVIFAVLSPIAFLQKAVFDAYLGAKNATDAN